jgi:hypothetical protein
MESMDGALHVKLAQRKGVYGVEALEASCVEMEDAVGLRLAAGLNVCAPPRLLLKPS